MTRNLPTIENSYMDANSIGIGVQFPITSTKVHTCTTKLWNVVMITDMDSSVVTITDGPENPEMSEVDGVTWYRDDFPFYGPLANRLSAPKRALVENLYPRRAVVTDGITYYLYCEGVASWSQLYSRVAANELLEITGINAPVNYANPLGWVYAMAKRIAFPIACIQPSVCIGTFRLLFLCEYEEDGPTVHFRPHWPVIPRGEQDAMYDRILSFVTSPIILPNPSPIPYKVVIDFMDPIIQKILAPLRYDQKLDFLWRLGKALIDKVENPSVIVFYGRDGHEGKSELAKNISRIFADAVTWVTEDLFGKESKWPKADAVMELCQYRILVCDECKINDGFSYNNIKRWTSEAPITSEGRTGYLCQTGIIVSNFVPFYEKAAVNNSIGRRLVIYHMTKKMSKYKALRRHEITSMVALKFIGLCIAIASAHVSPPVSLPMALYSVFRKNVNRITAGLVYDIGASREECGPATSAMAIRCGVTVEKLCSAFEAMSPSLVTKPKMGLPYINSIRTTRMTLTAHGNEVVDKIRGSEKRRYDLQSVLESGIAVGD